MIQPVQTIPSYSNQISKKSTCSYSGYLKKNDPIKPKSLCTLESNELYLSKKKSIPDREMGYLTRNDVVKTILTGAAVFILFGTQIAVITMIANLAIAMIFPKAMDNAWFNTKNAYKHITSETNKRLYFYQAIAFGLSALVKREQNAKQVVIQVLIQSLANPWRLAALLFRICTVAPIIEEIIFRGFIQEKIRDIQAYITQGNHNTTVQKTIRIFLQAILFGLCHYHVAQGIDNVAIILATTLLGYLFGTLKEKSQDLWSSMAIHGTHNTAVSSVILLQA